MVCTRVQIRLDRLTDPVGIGQDAGCLRRHDRRRLEEGKTVMPADATCRMELLPAFVRFLEDNRLLNFDGFQFDTRMRIQKYAYLSGRFGLDMGYDYPMYRYGPYSPGLADAHYELAEDPGRASWDDVALPGGFDRDGFLKTVSGRSDGWLEVAATLADLRGRFADDAALVAHVESIKCNYTVGFIGAVLRELQARRVL